MEVSEGERLLLLRWWEGDCSQPLGSGVCQAQWLLPPRHGSGLRSSHSGPPSKAGIALGPSARDGLAPPVPHQLPTAPHCPPDLLPWPRAGLQAGYPLRAAGSSSVTDTDTEGRGR